jgi:hypothetical protein
VANDPTAAQLLQRLLRPGRRSASAVTVEVFGWLLLLEGAAIVLAPQWVAALLLLPDFSPVAAPYFRLVGLLVSGLGLLYAVSGRLDARAFVFASLLDRPLVPPVMFLLWYAGLCPAILAALFAVQDGGGFLLTLRAWRNRG